MSAVGGLVGVGPYGWLTHRVSLGNLMRIGLVVETLTHLALALVTRAWLALPICFVFGAHAFVWGTTSTTVRQRAVPTELQGRVGSVNLRRPARGAVGGGGAVLVRLRRLGPFTVARWRQLAHVAHADEAPDARESPTA